MAVRIIDFDVDSNPLWAHCDLCGKRSLHMIGFFTREGVIQSRLPLCEQCARDLKDACDRNITS